MKLRLSNAEGEIATLRSLVERIYAELGVTRP